MALKRLLLAVGMAAGCLPALAAHAAVKFDGANVFTDGFVAVSATGARETDNSGQNSDAATSAKMTIDAPLSVYAKEGSGATLASAFTHQDAYAQFANKLNGDVEFSGTTSLSVRSPGGAAEAYDSGTSFNYDFTLTSDYQFTVKLFLC